MQRGAWMHSAVKTYRRLGGLDVRGSGKDVTQGLEPLSQHWCVHRDGQVWERNRSGGMEQAFSIIPHPGLGQRKLQCLPTLTSACFAVCVKPVFLMALDLLDALVMSLVIPTRPPTRVLSLLSSCLTDHHLPCLSSCKGSGRNVDATRAHPDTQGRRRRPDRGARGGQVFYNSEYGELVGPHDVGDCPPSARAPFFADDCY